MLLHTATFIAALLAVNGLPQNQCNDCIQRKVYNDVMLAFDVSDNVGIDGLTKAWKYAQNAFKVFNIQATDKSDKTSMHMGITLYSANVTVYKHLGSVSLQDFLQMPVPQYQGDGGARLDVAVYYSANELLGPNRRNNSRPVMVIFGDAFYGNPNMLGQVASGYHAQNGVFVVYDVTGNATGVMHALSPGSQFINTTDDGTQLRKIMCDVNCFCPLGTTAFQKSDDGKVVGGCYQAITNNVNYAFSKKRCNQAVAGGMIAIDDSANMTTFIMKENTNQMLWLGLEWNNSTADYRWPDNTPLGSYQPWTNSVFPSDHIGCLSLTVYGEWTSADCRLGLRSVCQRPPCDTSSVCDLP